VQEEDGEWLLLSNDDVITDGREIENADQLLLDARFETSGGKYTLSNSADAL